MKVLIACEFSGIVRDAFIKKGHDAVSCDLLPSDRPGPHRQIDVVKILKEKWDLMIAHPPCTFLTVAANKHMLNNPRRWIQKVDALMFVKHLMDCDIPKIAIENPKGAISSHIRKPDQIIQPWQFGHGETKETHLWLKGLPKLKPTNIVEGRADKCFRQAPGDDRWKIRSLTYQGIANAMAEQWGGDQS